MKIKNVTKLGAVALAAAMILPAVTSAGASSSGVIPAKVHVVVLGGATSDNFFAAVKLGVEAAAKAIAPLGGTVSYYGPPNYNNTGPDMANLEKSALAQKPQAVALPNWVPGAQSSGIKQMVAAGIHVIEYNTSGDYGTTWKTDGAVSYVGSNDGNAGILAGETMVKNDDKDLVCVNTGPGQTNFEARCGGIKKVVTAAGGKYKELDLPGSAFSDPTAIIAAIKGALSTDSSIDGVILMGATEADYGAQAISQAGKTGKVTLGAFDLSTSNLKRIIAGTQLFSIDQQPYLQGFYATMEAFQYAKYGVLPSAIVQTGPSLVVKANAALALAGAAAGVRGNS